MEDALKLWEKVNPDVRAAYSSLVHDERPKRGRVCPRGYTRNDDIDNPIPEIQRLLLEELFEVRYRKSRSLRVSLAKIKPIFDVFEQKLPAAGGYAMIFKRLEKDLGLVATQKKHISARHKMFKEVVAQTGKHPSTKDLKAEYAKIKYAEKKRDLDAARKEQVKAQNAMARQARIAKISGKKLVKDTVKKETIPRKSCDNPAVDAYLKGVTNNVGMEEQMDLYIEAMKEAEGRPVAFLPTPKQYQFLAASEDFVLYGGAAGGGKSYAILFDAVRYAHMKGYRGVIIRRSMPELRELIDISREIYPAMFGKANTKYNSSEKTWRFPSGAILEFGFLDNPADKYQYQGKQYAWVGFDELGLQATPEGFDYLKSRLRTTLPIKPSIRCTANPGSLWVKERFIDPAPPNTTFRDKVGLTYRFIPSLISDNPYMYQNGEGQYVKMLSSMSEVERRQLLEGDWTVSDDSAFPEFKVSTHVIPGDTFIPKHWNRFAGIDYGFNDNAAVVWCAVNPENGQIVVYKEFAQRGLHGFDFAQAIMHEEQEELVNVDHVVDHTIWNVTGQIGPTIGMDMQRAGLRMRRADKNRTAGKGQIHARLANMPHTDIPGIVILDSCPKLIRELQSLKRAEKTASQEIEDIKQTRLNGNHNDLYDAIRYALMSRPRTMTSQDRYLASKTESRWGSINQMFS